MQRQPLGIVRDPSVLLMIIGTVLLGMLVIRISSLTGAKRFTESLRSRGRLEAERLQPPEIFIGVVVTIVGAFLTRMLAIAFRLKGWAYGW